MACSAIKSGKRRKLSKPANTFRFLELPAEIRNQIYRLAVVNHEPLHITDVRVACPLSHVCQQIRSESLPIFLKLNTFYYEPGDEEVWKKARITKSQPFTKYVDKLRFATAFGPHPHLSNVIVHITMTSDRRGIMYTNKSIRWRDETDAVLPRLMISAFNRCHRYRRMDIFKLFDLIRHVVLTGGDMRPEVYNRLIFMPLMLRPGPRGVPSLRTVCSRRQGIAQHDGSSKWTTLMLR